MKNPWNIAAVLIALGVIAGMVWWTTRTNTSETILLPAPQNPGWQKFIGDTYSVSYPPGYTIDTEYEYQALGPGKEIPGVSFTIPDTLTIGTNLSTDTRLSIEHAEGECDASRFIFVATSTTVTDAGVRYSFASTTDAGAGNRYEELVYVQDTIPCLIVRYLIHYAVVENFDPGTIKEFDRATLTAEFDRIRRSIVITE